MEDDIAPGGAHPTTVEMSDTRSIEWMLPILRCPSCSPHGSLNLRDGAAAHFDISVPLSRSTLQCERCLEHYPITDDLIPILWSEEMKRAFSDFNREPEASRGAGGGDASDNLRANVQIYDTISNDYEAYTRQSSALGTRLSNSVSRVFAGRPTEGLFHLDFACGPGHVLKWLKRFGFEQVGLDVSLANLRNARKSTGSFVVCGDASRMPFADDAFSLVTESSALHHILDWKAAVSESCRVCGKTGGVIMDSEPSDLQMDWSPLAIAVFNARFPCYKLLSYFVKGKYMFRDIEQAKLNLKAEIHHQPGTGIPVGQLKNIFEDQGFAVEVIVSPTTELTSRANPDWKLIVLNLLSGRNPWNPDYGGIVAIATSSY